MPLQETKTIEDKTQKMVEDRVKIARNNGFIVAHTRLLTFLSDYLKAGAVPVDKIIEWSKHESQDAHMNKIRSLL